MIQSDYDLRIPIICLFLFLNMPRIHMIENVKLYNRTISDQREIAVPDETEDVVFKGPWDIFCADQCSLKMMIIEKREMFATQRKNSDCSSGSVPIVYRSSKYRSIDGSFNNLEHPSWGKAGSCLRRILPFDYADGIQEPRSSCLGDKLPNARAISNLFHIQRGEVHGLFTTHFMEWGQFIAHDLSFNDLFRLRDPNTNAPISCCTPDAVESETCIAVEVPPNDPFYAQHGVTCISFTRSIPCPLNETSVRQHWNQNTAFHDASLVYGSRDDVAASLRTKSNGMLIGQENPNGPLLPGLPISQSCTSRNTTEMCFKSGDPRTNQNVLILAQQTIFFRHHNRLCEELKEINPHWDDETLYQEARRIVIAQAQMITYGHYLKHVLGATILAEDDLEVLSGSSFTKYDPHLDPSIADEFTAAAQRYGHTLIANSFTEINPKTNSQRTIQLRNYFFNPFEFYKGQLDPLSLGMARDLHMKHDSELGDDVRNFLYRDTKPTGVDLAALSITRGRDHGIPSYTHYLKYFFNESITSFCDLRKYIPDTSLVLLKMLYRYLCDAPVLFSLQYDSKIGGNVHPDDLFIENLQIRNISVHDIDLYTAGLAENHVKGGIVGPTFAAILRDQYKRMKFGDRYYFEHGNQEGSFTKEQLKELKKTTLSKIICDNTKIHRIQKDVFLPPSLRNPTVSCDHIPSPNLSKWKHCQ